MQTYTKKRRSWVPIFDNTYQPSQQIKDVPRHQISDPMTPASVSSTKRRQQTLTQLTPSLSNPRSEEDLGDLEYEEWPKKRHPPKRSKSSAKKRLDQQTITQMDPFRQQLYPEEDIDNLVEEPLIEKEHLRRRKKKGLELEESITPGVQSGSFKSKGRKDVFTYIEAGKYHPTYNDQLVDPPPGPKGQQSLMPPPVTPKTTRKREIPSSQSPDDTPYTNRSIKSRRENSASPLKERSVNTPSRNFSARRRDVEWIPKLEVANSTDLSSRNNSIATSMATPPRPAGSHCLSQDLSGRSIQSRVATSSVHAPVLRIVPSSVSSDSDSTPLRSSPDSRQSMRDVKSRLEDSFWGRPQEGWKNVNGADIADLSSTHPASHGSTTQESPAAANLSTADDHQDGNTYHTIPTQLLNHRAGELSYEYTFDEFIEENSSPSRRDATTLLQEQSQHRRSTSEEVSLQSHGERLQPSEAPRYELATLETESQFESAWRQYTPQEDEDDIKAELPDTAIQAIQIPSSQSKYDDIKTAPPDREFQTAQAASSKSYHILYNEDPQIAPVPPSQATTTDASESSPRRFLTPFPPRKDPPSHNLASSPTTDHSSSSPSRTRQDSGASTYMGWDGVRSTYSQLYPPSLMDETVPEPPMWTHESVELDEEGG